MRLDSLRLESFRCLSNREFDFSPEINVISGENGTGKTSLLEAVAFLSLARSPRTHRESEMIAFASGTARISSVFFSQDRNQTLDITLSRTGRRVMERNGASIKSPRDLVGLLPSVFFQPGDLDLVRGGAAGRRLFMDMAICQIYPRYLDTLSSYKKLHERKLKLLRLGASEPGYLEALPDYNLRLAQTGAAIAVFRTDFVKKVAGYAKIHHEDISSGKESLSLHYKTHASDAGETFEHMQARREAELARMQCLVGAHRDDITAEIASRAPSFASQGQTRTAALAMKLALRDTLNEELGEPPLLLLDDVLSELDERRQDYVLNHIAGGQVFITACEVKKLTSRGMNIALR